MLIKFNMAAINLVNVLVAKQTFLERLATNYFGSTTIQTGSNHLCLVVSLYKATKICGRR